MKISTLISIFTIDSISLRCIFTVMNTTAVAWTIELPYASIPLPFAVGDRISHHGQRVEITHISQTGTSVSFLAKPTSEPARILHNGKFLYAI